MAFESDSPRLEFGRTQVLGAPFFEFRRVAILQIPEELRVFFQIGTSVFAEVRQNIHAYDYSPFRGRSLGGSVAVTARCAENLEMNKRVAAADGRFRYQCIDVSLRERDWSRGQENDLRVDRRLPPPQSPVNGGRSILGPLRNACFVASMDLVMMVRDLVSGRSSFAPQGDR